MPSYVTVQVNKHVCVVGVEGLELGQGTFHRYEMEPKTSLI